MNKKSFIILLTASSVLSALPSGGSVQSGGANISTTSTTVDVTTSATTNIINWTSFDVSSGQSVTFARTGSNAGDTFYVFNKVTGSSASTISGGITAPTNGIIYLVNPNGVTITSTGTVVSGGFVVSALDMSGTFAPGIDLTFTGTGTLTVNGSVTATAQDATFLGYRVVTGSAATMTAQNTCAIGAGSDLIYQPNDVDRIYIQTAGTPSTGTGIDHQGTATGVSVMMKADGNIYTLAINQAGTIQASSCTSTGGKIKLIADPKTNNKGAVEMTGSISRSCTTSGVGPDVEIYGHSVALQSGSSIAVSGVSGGRVTIGTATTYPTENVYIDSNATITSSGTTGDGGALTVYGGTSLLYLGSSTTSSTSGNGGAINMESPGYIGINGSANASSTSGTDGTFAMTGDTIKVGAAANYGSNFQPPDYTTASVDSIITESSIEGILGNGNVTVIGANIDVETVDINWSSGNLLTLNASTQLDISKLLAMSGSTFSGTSVVSLISPNINILSSSDVGVHVTSGDISATASDTFLLQGSTNGSSLFQTDAGVATLSINQRLNLRGNGGIARVSATTTNINGQTANTADISLQGGACGSATIVGSTAVNIGTTTAIDDLEIIAGSCGSGLESGITGGAITITANGDVLIQGGASGAGNIGIIQVGSGSQNDITISSQSITLQAGAAGVNNSARIVNNSNDGQALLTTTQNLSLNGGGASTTGSIADINTKSNTFTVGNNFTMQGGGGVSSLASVYGYNGTTINATGDIGMYSGSALYTHAQVTSDLGDINFTSGRSIYMVTSTAAHSNVFTTTENGAVSYNAGNDIRMQGSCTIPNQAYVFSGGTGNITFTATGDISRNGNTLVSPQGTGTFTHTEGGTYTETACPATIIVFTSTPAVFEYYLYDFLYELFYRMNYFGLYDWYLFHSSDFWIRHTFTAP